MITKNFYTISLLLTIIWLITLYLQPASFKNSDFRITNGTKHDLPSLSSNKIRAFKLNLENLSETNIFLSRIKKNPTGNYPIEWFKIGKQPKGISQIIKIGDHQFTIALTKLPDHTISFVAYSYIVDKKYYSSFKVAELFRILKIILLDPNTGWYIKADGKLAKQNLSKIRVLLKNIIKSINFY